MKNIEKYKDRLGKWDEEHQGYFRVDPLTDEIFYASSRRRIHLSDRNRSQFHNRKNSDENYKLSQIQTKFRRSYKALQKLHPKSLGKEEVRITELLYEGFDEKSTKLTAINKATNRPVYWYGDYGVEKTGENMCIIYKN